MLVHYVIAIDINMAISLNCDMGESFGLWRFGDDAGIMPYIDLANIACGFHAGDPVTMQRTVELAKSHGKKIGAHPSLPDREGFGRRQMHLRPEELKAAFIYQIGALAGFARAAGYTLNHVKPHGIVYGMSARDRAAANAIAEAAKVFELPLLGLAGTMHQQAAEEVDIPFLGEFFADLPYGPSGEMIILRQHSTVDVDAAAKRLERAIRDREVEAADGTVIPLTFETVCIHSDPPNARDVAAAMRRVIDSAGVV